MVEQESLGSTAQRLMFDLLRMEGNTATIPSNVVDVMTTYVE